MVSRLLRVSPVVTALAAASLVMACSDSIASPGTGGPPPIQTDRTSYQLQETVGRGLRVEIPYAYHNTTGKTVYLVNCKVVQAGLQKQVEDEWVDAWGGVYNDCLGPAIEVAAGASYVDTMVVSHYPGAFPRFSVEPIDGTYRIAWSSTRTVHNYDDSFSDGSWGDSLPLADRISNEFTLSK